jgi:hypothetical protein
MAGVTHVEGDVTASFVISPLQGTGVVYSGAYREQATGNFLIVDDQDIPHPAASFYLHGTSTGSDGSQIRFTHPGTLGMELMVQSTGMGSDTAVQPTTGGIPPTVGP